MKVIVLQCPKCGKQMLKDDNDSEEYACCGGKMEALLDPETDKKPVKKNPFYPKGNDW